MSEQFKEVIDLLKKGEGGKAFHELGKALGHHKDGGVKTLDDSGNTPTPPPPSGPKSPPTSGG